MKEQEIARKMTMAWSIAFEGSISMAKVKRPLLKGPQYYPRISLDNTDKSLLAGWVLLVGYGNVYHHRRYSSAWKDLYQWAITSQKDIKKFLEDIIPFLPAKQMLAGLMLNFINRRLDKGWVGMGMNRKLHHVSFGDADEQVYQQMKILNQRGKGVKK
ncbi:MAG: hypothetical protein ABIH23_27815 [bacterium]